VAFSLAIWLAKSVIAERIVLPLAGNAESSLKPSEGIAQSRRIFGSEDRSECEKKVSLTRLGSRPADFGGGKLDAFERTFVREQSAG
jgi:hypothetical protein